MGSPFRVPYRATVDFLAHVFYRTASICVKLNTIELTCGIIHVCNSIVPACPGMREEESGVDPNEQDGDDAVLTVKQISERLGVGRDAVLWAIRRGELPAKKFGNRGGYRVRLKDFREWLGTPSRQKGTGNRE
jgi:excisionase family DNA binding protein